VDSAEDSHLLARENERVADLKFDASQVFVSYLIGSISSQLIVHASGNLLAILSNGTVSMLPRGFAIHASCYSTCQMLTSLGTFEAHLVRSSLVGHLVALSSSFQIDLLNYRLTVIDSQWSH